MRTWSIIAAVVFQVGILAYMGGQREYILRTGKTVYLRTAPVDPQDAFRGDYVHLDYDISNVSRIYLRDGLKNKTAKGTRVYAVLDVDENQSGQLEYITDELPKDKPFIRGRIDNDYGGLVSIRYGIEAYFVQQGKGTAIENLRGQRQGIQVPLEMETALGSNGIAVLKKYRSGQLGIGIELKSDPKDRTRRVYGAKIKLKNVSDKPLAIIDLSDGRSFSLEQDLRWAGPGFPIWQWVNANAAAKPVENSDVHVLQASQEYEFTIDFRNPAWFVQKGDEPPRTISDPNMGWGNNFRMVYRPPSKDECKQLDKADMIWHGYLRSSVFNGGGRID